MIVKASRITHLHSHMEQVTVSETGSIEIFNETQLMPAPDGSWIAVDWIKLENLWSWYVVELNN